MSPKIEAITDHALELGEGPHWDARTQALYFVGSLEGTINRYTATGGHTKTKIDGRPIGFIIPVEDHLDQFVVGLGQDFAVVQWDGAEGSAAPIVRTLGSVDVHEPQNRLNDAKADPRGRLFSGTITQVTNITTDKSVQQKASFYRLDQGGITKLGDKISVSNGLAWDLATGAFYYIDSIERKIRKYDYDVETGNISNLTYFFDFEKHNIEGSPDGMTIDTNGNLWVAVFGTGCIHQISPQGELLRRVRLPVPQVTSCTFGGPDLDVLFVTSAYLDVGSGQLQPPSGYTFKITGLGVKGHPNRNVKL